MASLVTTSFIIKGDKELTQRFEEFPAHARAKLTERITALTAELQKQVQAHYPVSGGKQTTGELHDAITESVYSDSETRIAGYVSVVMNAGGKSKYAKAAALEYGIDGTVRKMVERAEKQGALGMLHRMMATTHALNARAAPKAVHMPAFRYLRDPIEEMRPQVEAELAAAVDEAVAEANQE